MSRTRRWLAVTELPEFNVAVFAFLLNYPWEFSQVPLFGGMADAPHWSAIQRCALAALGDIVIMLIAYWLVALIARSRHWIAAPTAAHLTMFVAVGVAITILIEHLALRGWWFSGWDYSPLMPVIPGIGVGLSPLAQWLVLPLLTVWFVRRQLAASPRFGKYVRADAKPRAEK
ncbi:MAG: hypothetical protein ACRECQ_09400 [Burkholderiaceae bacterium]